jgi:two-component system chemotaxis response regulator CheB
MPSGGSSALPTILHRAGPLPAVFARSGMPLDHGRVYVARPDHHLLVAEDRFVLSHGPTENGHRPAVDALFRSAAVARGARVIGVVLSGVLDDGVAGAVAIRGRRGLVVVQDPEDALHPGMPENTLRYVRTRHVLPAADMGPLLAELVREPVGLTSVPPPSPEVEQENRIVHRWEGGVNTHMIGETSEYTCPDCHGVLNEVEADALRFRCQIGHAWSAEALAQAQGDSFEKALWTALRTLEEKVSLSQRMLESADGRQADRYRGRLEESAAAAEQLRGFLLSLGEHDAPDEDTMSGNATG